MRAALNTPEKRTMGVQIPEEMIARLKKYAVEEDRSLAWHIRRAIAMYLGQKGRRTESKSETSNGNFRGRRLNGANDCFRCRGRVSNSASEAAPDIL